MITQYSRVQLTLSEKEKEYAWFSYAAKIIRAGCNDQQMSGYTVTVTGIDGQEMGCGQFLDLMSKDVRRKK